MTASLNNDHHPQSLGAMAPSVVARASERPSGEGVAWLELNVARPLEKVRDRRLALDERLRLQGLACARLDEFFTEHTVEPGRAGATEAKVRAHALMEALHRGWREQLQVELEEGCGIRLAPACRWTPEERSSLRREVAGKIWPLLTPLAVDQGHPFPTLPDRRLNLAVMLYKDCQCRVRRDKTFAIVTVPTLFGRVLELVPGAAGRKTFVLLEEVIATNLGLLFPGFRVGACCPFRITRRQTLARGTLDSESSRRASRHIVRLEIAAEAPLEVEALLRLNLGLQASEVCHVDGPLHLGDLSALAAHLRSRAALRTDTTKPLGQA